MLSRCESLRGRNVLFTPSWGFSSLKSLPTSCTFVFSSGTSISPGHILLQHFWITPPQVAHLAALLELLATTWTWSCCVSSTHHPQLSCQLAHQFLLFPDFSSALFHQDLLNLAATVSIQSLLTNTFVLQLLEVAHQTHLPSPHLIPS